MNWGRLFFGLLIVAVGTVLLLDNAGVLDAGEIFGTWWPAVLVLAGILTFAANPRHWPVALIITGIGVAFLLSNLDIVDIGSIVIPAAIILVGLLVIFGRGLGSPTEAGDRVNSFNVFSGSEIASHSKQFQGGSISAVFGGAEVDLRDT
ncbi:MAG: LiaF transmembrane domain-containing protein, partial [Acidimicrobiia bacterium]